MRRDSGDQENAAPAAADVAGTGAVSAPAVARPGAGSATGVTGATPEGAGADAPGANASASNAASTGRGVSSFDASSDDVATAALLACCASPAWVSGVLAGRPYGTADRLFAASDAVLAALDDRDIDAALAGHPRIGDRPADAESARDQAGVSGADRAVLDALAEGNRAYEQRFGHIYLVCAAGRTADELLGVLRSRLDNDPATERAVLRAELAKINRVRLRRLLDEPAAGGRA